MTVVITIAQRKGGAGKTTLAAQLIAALIKSGRSVGALDTDDQASLTYWASLRETRLGALDFALETTSGYGIGPAVRRLQRGTGAVPAPDFVIIDTPPTIDRALNRAMTIADLVLVPMQLSPLDLDATLPTARLIGEVDCKALFVINRSPPRARIADLIRSQIRQTKLPLAKTELGNRTVFSESMVNGEGVVETAPNSQAASEINALVKDVERCLGIARKSRSRQAA